MDNVLKIDTSDKYIVPGLDRGLRILCEFSRREPVLSSPELARRLGIPRSTVFRLLTTLERMGFVERDAGGRDYCLGLGVLRLGFECLASKELAELGKPILEKLRDEINYTCNLVVRDGRSVVYVVRSVVSSPYSNTVQLGTRLPAHATLLGRVLLSDLSFAQLQELYPEEQLQAATAKTPATVAELYRRIQADKASECVWESAYFEPSIATLAVPVRGGESGAVVSALGITLPSSHAGDSSLVARLSKIACAAAGELSQLLDHVVALPSPDISRMHERKQ